MTDEEQQAAANLLRVTKHNATNELVQHMNSLTQNAMNTLPQCENRSWTRQYAEACAITEAGDSASLSLAPLLVAIAEIEFGEADESTRLAQVKIRSAKILLDDAAWMKITALIIGVRSRVQRAMDEANDPAVVTALLSAGKDETLAGINPAPLPPEAPGGEPQTEETQQE